MHAKALRLLKFEEDRAGGLERGSWEGPRRRGQAGSHARRTSDVTLGETEAWGAQSRAGALSDLGSKGLPLRPAEKGLWRRGAGEDGLAAEAPRRGQVPGMFTRTRAQACLASCCNHVARRRVWHR